MTVTRATKEVSFRATAVGCFLVTVFAVASVYLAIKSGATAAATVPAALALVYFGRVHFLSLSSKEQNLARTVSTTGEILAAAAVFTLPALYFVLGQNWSYRELMLTIAAGGLLGIPVAVALSGRRIFESQRFDYPEVKACEDVLTTARRMPQAPLAWVSSLCAAAFAVCKSLGLDSPAEKPVSMGSDFLTLGSVQAPSPSPAFLGLGYYLGRKTSCEAFLGSVLLAIVAFPLISLGGGDAADWTERAQLVAIGCVLIGGLLTFIEMGTASLLAAFRAPADQADHVDLSEDDAESRSRTSVVLAASILALGVVLLWTLGQSKQALIPSGHSVAVVVLLIATTASIAGVVGCFCVGLLGSSSNPISAIALIVAALMLVAGLSDIPAVVFAATVCCIAAGVSGNLLQDLRIGRAVGGSPIKITAAQLVGVAVSAVVVPGAMLLFLSTVPDLADEENRQMPQASSLAKFVGLAQGDPHNAGGGQEIDPQSKYVAIGVLLGLGLWSTRRVNPLLVGIGMYLPMHITGTLAVGGIMRWGHDTWLDFRGATEKVKKVRRGLGVALATGLLIAEVLVAVVWAFLEVPTITPSGFGIALGAGILGLMAALLLLVPLRSSIVLQRNDAASSVLFLVEPCFHGDRYMPAAALLADRVVVVRRREFPTPPGGYTNEVITKNSSAEAMVDAVSRWLESSTWLRAGVLPGNEYAVPQAALIAERMNWIGNSVASAKAARSKSLMRLALQEGGARCPHSVTCRSIKEVERAACELGLPVVLKPTDMACSLLVRKVDTVRELLSHAKLILSPRRNLINYPLAEEVLVEQYVEGEEYSIEMFLHEGSVRYASVTEKIKTSPPYFVELQHVVPATTPSEDAKRELIASATQAAVEALGLTNGPIHAEIIANEAGHFIVEIAARQPGDEITTLLRLAGGVDLHNASIRQALGLSLLESELRGLRSGASIRYLTASPGIVTDISGVRDALNMEGVAEVCMDVDVGSLVRRLTSSEARIGFVIASAATGSEAKRIARRASRQIRVNTR